MSPRMASVSWLSNCVGLSLNPAEATGLSEEMPAVAFGARQRQTALLQQLATAVSEEVIFSAFCAPSQIIF